MKRIITLAATVLFLLFACGCTEKAKKDEISCVATVFPAYDFARAVAGDDADVQMLLPPGTEIHTYEPSPQDITAIQNADIFIYTGGESDFWVQKVLSSVQTDNMQIIKMMENAELLCEEGENGHNHEHEHEYDEHVWTSPENAKKIITAVADAFGDVDAVNSKNYQERAKTYCDEIEKLAKETKAVAEKVKKLVVADRFPLKYFCEYYSLDYLAAFSACDLLADADAQTVAELINTVRKEKISAVYYIENGSGYLADTVCSETGAKKIKINSLHTISRDDFLSGITYLDVMKYNKEALERGLE